MKWAHDNSKLALVKGAEEPIIRHFEYKLILEFNDSALVVQSNNYLTKLINAHIVYGLDNWQKNPSNNFYWKVACLVLLM